MRRMGARAEYSAVMDALEACIRACNSCAASCLQEDDVKMLARCIKLDFDCAAVCSLTLQYASGSSEFVKQATRLCAEICDVCAKECRKHSDMEHCRICAEACESCAKECR